MPFVPSPVTLAQLTDATLAGPGVFDTLMRANKAHLESEFTKGRIKGAEYATVYLGSLEAVMSASLAFLLQRDKASLESELLTKQILLVTQQGLNAVIEGEVLTATKCKLQAEFDLLATTNLKTQQELQLLLWKTNTEKAQTIALGVDADSVLGKQKALYGAQTTGFTRDAEQKAAKLMADTWAVRRTTDEATVADAVNSLNDAAVGRAIGKLLTGVGA